MKKRTAWRTRKMCKDCPFHTKGPGLRLRNSLQERSNDRSPIKDRWNQILQNLVTGGHFHCHETTRETGDGSTLVCSGSIAWQHRVGVESHLEIFVNAFGLFQDKEPNDPKRQELTAIHRNRKTKNSASHGRTVPAERN